VGGRERSGRHPLGTRRSTHIVGQQARGAAFQRERLKPLEGRIFKKAREKDGREVRAAPGSDGGRAAAAGRRDGTKDREPKNGAECCAGYSACHGLQVGVHAVAERTISIMSEVGQADGSAGGGMSNIQTGGG